MADALDELSYTKHPDGSLEKRVIVAPRLIASKDAARELEAIMAQRDDLANGVTDDAEHQAIVDALIANYDAQILVLKGA